VTAERVIWKFVLEPGRPVMMPTGAKVLHVGGQKDTLTLWAECNPVAVKEPRRFHVMDTGGTLPENAGRYLGTAMLYQQSLVLHVYDPEGR
jgi:hypothetical protein